MRKLRPISKTSWPAAQAKSTAQTSVARLPVLPLAAISAQATSTKPSKLRRVPSSTGSGALCFDLENRPLAYWWDGRATAEITAIGWKWRHETQAHALVLRRDGMFENDHGEPVPAGRALGVFKVLLCRAHVVYGHNIRDHDLRLFNTALLRARMGPLPALRTSDTLRDYPRRKDMSASLENLARLYGLGDGKKHMSVHDWETANRLDPDGIALTRDRVVSDVLLQEQLRDKLLELDLLGATREWRPRR